MSTIACNPRIQPYSHLTPKFCPYLAIAAIHCNCGSVPQLRHCTATVPIHHICGALPQLRYIAAVAVHYRICSTLLHLRCNSSQLRILTANAAFHYNCAICPNCGNAPQLRQLTATAAMHRKCGNALQKRNCTANAAMHSISGNSLQLTLTTFAVHCRICGTLPQSR